MTQAELAEQADLGTVFISKIERGVANPSTQTLTEIAKALDIPLRDLFDFDESGGWSVEAESVTFLFKDQNGRQLRKTYKLVES